MATTFERVRDIIIDQLGVDPADVTMEANFRDDLEADSLDQDPDGALWRYVWVGRRCANAEMIRGGYAFHLPQSPNYLHMEWFARLEAEAKRKKRGIWR